MFVFVLRVGERVTLCLQSIQPADVPMLTRTLSVIDELPEPLNGVSEREWLEFRREVFSDQ